MNREQAINDARQRAKSSNAPRFVIVDSVDLPFEYAVVDTDGAKQRGWILVETVVLPNGAKFVWGLQ